MEFLLKALAIVLGGVGGIWFVDRYVDPYSEHYSPRFCVVIALLLAVSLLATNIK